MTGRLHLLQFGASGQLARELCRVQAAATDELSATVIARAQADFGQPDDVVRAVMSARQLDLVVNAAAYTAVDKAESDEETARRINATTVGVLAQACHDRGVPLIHISTDYVYDGLKPSPYVESDPTGPISAYGRSKLEGEDLIRATLPQHVILRTSWVYSAHGANFVKTMLRLGVEREELHIVDDQRGAPTAAADLAAAILKIAQQLKQGNASFGTFHFADAGETTWRKFAEEIFRQAPWAGIRARVTPITSADYPLPARRPANSRLDLQKIHQVFGITPSPWQDSLASVLAELKESIP